MILFFFFFAFFSETELTCSFEACPETQFVDQAGLELLNSPECWN